MLKILLLLLLVALATASSFEEDVAWGPPRGPLGPWSRRIRRFRTKPRACCMAFTRQCLRCMQGKPVRYRQEMEVSDDLPEVELSEEHAQWFEEALSNASDEELEAAISQMSEQELANFMATVVKYGKKYGPKIVTLMKKYGPALWKKFGPKIIDGFKKLGRKIKDGFKKAGRKIKKGWNKVFGGKRRRKFRRALDSDSEELELSEEEEQLADFLNNSSEEEIESMIANAKDEQEVQAIFTLAATAATTALPFIIKYGKKYWPKIKAFGKKIGSKIKKGFKKVGTKIKKGWNKVFGGRRRRKFRRALFMNKFMAAKLKKNGINIYSEELELSEKEEREEELAGVLSQLSEEEIAEIEDMSEEELADWFFSLKKAWKGIKKNLSKAGKWTKRTWKTVKKKLGRRALFMHKYIAAMKLKQKSLDSDSEEFELSQLSEEKIAEIEDMSEEELADWFFSLKDALKRVKKGRRALFMHKYIAAMKLKQKSLDSDSEEFELSQLSEEKIAEIEDMSEEELADWFFSLKDALKRVKKGRL